MTVIAGAGAKLLPSYTTLPAVLSYCTDGETEAQKGEEASPRLHNEFSKVSVPARASVSPSG